MTAPLAVPLTRPLLAVVRLRPAPPLEPPVERIRRGGRHLRVVHPPVELPFGDDGPRADVLPLPPRVDVPDEKADPFGPLPTSRTALPDPADQARNLVVAVLEVLGGRRPLQQLMPHLDEKAYESVARQLAASLRYRPERQPEREPDRRPDQQPDRPLGGRPTVRPSPTGGVRTRLGIGTPRVCEPADGVAEVSLVVRWGGRVRAVAVRLEGIDGRWRCTVLEIV